MLFLVTKKNRIKQKPNPSIFYGDIFYHFINFSMIFADDESQRIPPPGCTLPPKI
jgi:hypothetical protein